MSGRDTRLDVTDGSLFATDGPTEHAYPHDLALLVQARWPETHASEEEGRTGYDEVAGPVPELSVLEPLLSVCYQASLLREEGRPVTFRIALSDPEAFAVRAGPPGGLHRLIFTDSRPLDEHELRRLAPAVTFHRSLIGVHFDDGVGLRIWGMIHSGPGWLQSVRGGRDVEQVIPPVLVVAVTGPGRLLVSKGTLTLGALSAGTLAALAMDVLRASWMTEILAGIYKLQSPAHVAAREQQPNISWEELDPIFGQLLAQHVLRRVLATIRGGQHGGMLILLPVQAAEEVLADSRCIYLKYRFRDEEPRRRILSLIVQIINELARIQGASTAGSGVGWKDYEASGDPRLASLDEALFEVAHLIAALADVDGAVVMTKSFELLGFGGEISGTLPEVTEVARALDLEGNRRDWVGADRVGTRHRSAYRLCQFIHDALVVVISQDGGLRFIRWHDRGVTYWDQIATGPWEV